MATPANPTPSAPCTRELTVADLCAVFVIDAGGKVVASNASARRLWSAGERALVTLPFAALFELDESEADSDQLAAAWLTLKAQANERWTQVTALPFGGGSVDAWLRIERAAGGAGSYFASVVPRAAGS